MNEDTMEDIIKYVREKEKLAWEGRQLLGSGEPKSVNNYGPGTVAMLLGVIAQRLERLVERGLYITPKAALDAVAGDRPLDKMLKTPMSEESRAVSEGRGEEEREHMSRAEAVRILMQLQAIEARDGHPNINEALEMAIAAVLKRHRDICRNKAKRRAARMANSAAEAAAEEINPVNPVNPV